MINSQVLANAVAVVTGAVYIVCRVLAAVAPNLVFAVGQSWFHTINLSSMRAAAPMALGVFLLGLVSSVAVVWLVAYATAELYNRWAK